MRRATIAVLVVAGLLVLLGIYYLAVVSSAATGNAQLDSARWALAAALLGRASLSPGNLRGLVAILNQERTPVGVVGDTGIAKGPSGGRLQVLRETAIELGLWPSTGESLADQVNNAADWQAYYAFAADPANDLELLRWGVVVYLDKLRQAGGDHAQALLLYNGAASYEEAALEFETSLGWDTT